MGESEFEAKLPCGPASILFLFKIALLPSPPLPPPLPLFPLRSWLVWEEGGDLPTAIFLLSWRMASRFINSQRFPPSFRNCTGRGERFQLFSSSTSSLKGRLGFFEWAVSVKLCLISSKAGFTRMDEKSSCCMYCKKAVSTAFQQTFLHVRIIYIETQ